ncbi:glucosaminidase domain-containing protein [Neobacillus sp. FSL H8-0543]|uniref:glucosaminidase domain-containing protein n=1 Tax=Neobacillus sp. FSL H8-0543 TaxID=2954672 RepID=UPI003158F2FB
MNVGPLSTNWLLYKTIMDTSRIGQSDRTNLSGLSSTSFGILLEQALLQAQMNQNGTEVSSLLFANLNLSPAVGVDSSLKRSLPTLTSETTSGAVLNNQLKGVLENTGHLFVAAGEKYQINPAFLASISMHETGNGTSNAARFKYNVAGMMGKNGLKTYASIEESIFDMARNLRENYLDKGKLTISQIGAKYAPIGATNDPNQLNNHWVTGVQSNFDTLAKGTDIA